VASHHARSLHLQSRVITTDRRVTGRSAKDTPIALPGGSKTTMRIGSRMSAGFGSLAALLAVTGGLGWSLASQQITSTSDEERALVATQDIKQYQLDAAGVAVAANSVAYDFSSHSDPTSDIESLSQSTDAAHTDGVALAALVVGAAERSALAQAAHALDVYIALSNQVDDDFSAGTPSALKAAHADVVALEYHTVTKPLGNLEEQVAARNKSVLTATAAEAARDRVLVVVLMLVALGVAGGIGAIVTRAITSRLKRTMAVLEQVATGDLTKRIDVDSSDEVAQMGAALNLALDRVEDRARGQRFESRLANALDMADNEAEVLAVIERSFASTVPESPIELLLADNSHAHLHRMAAASSSGGLPGCSVESPDHCPAARRAQVQHFDDSEALDACPKLRGRPSGPCQAVCVPVSIMGRTVGVMHGTSALAAPFTGTQLFDLGVLAKLGGARIGMLRLMSETQLQAATDALTGLLNRRSFEKEVAALRSSGTALSLVMADLDHFKVLNDTHGHPAGDRALVLFAQMLRSSFRSQDVIGRHGGEEFIVALPGCTTANAQRSLEGLRSRLDAAITVAGLPRFTASFGVVEATQQEDLPTLIGRADACLFIAKRDGRDRIVVGPASAGQVSLSELPGVATSLRGLDPLDYRVPEGPVPTAH
jgi:diguanylate cyclase (GGDEF)-like protein